MTEVERVAKWHAAHPARRKQHKDKWIASNPTYFHDYYLLNATKKRKQVAEYKRSNAGKINAACMRRYAIKLQATPPWLTRQHWEAIEAVYVEASHRQDQDGIKRHVDHIYPLQGKMCCGLHVPWNLQILIAVDNCRKNNRMPNKEKV